jgi:hypothetical protein
VRALPISLLSLLLYEARANEFSSHSGYIHDRPLPVSDTKTVQENDKADEVEHADERH